MPSALEQRLDLHEKLVSILGDPKHVYFQPPESVDKLVELPYCTFDRYFVSENLNHYIFLLYHDGKLTEEV